MAIQNISNLAIEDSFQGLVQHDTASLAIGTALGATISEIAVTASFATTASYAINSAPQVSASFATSASVADFASQAAQADSAGFATSATTAVSASFSEGARNATSASFAEDARTADFATTSTSASYALVAASVQGTIESASFAENARTADSATSASFSEDARTADSSISSSLAARNFLSATTDFSEITFTDGAGNTSTIDATPRKVIESVKNADITTLGKGTPVYVSGSTGNALNVYKADAADASKMPATFVLNETLDPTEEGTGILSGFINGVSTVGFNDGDSVWVAAGGGYTNVKPTGANLIQRLGNVIVGNSVNGSGVISPNEETDVPNITSGYAWVGNENQVATAVSTASFNVASASNADRATSASIADDIKDGIDVSFNSGSFNDIVANTLAVTNFTAVTSSVVITGDAYIQLNNDTPVQRYAGIKVQDSGSNTTASLEYDGQTNDWFYDYEGDDPTNFGIVMFGPEYSTKGSPVYNTANTILKSNGGHHTLDSIITDDGSTVVVGGDLEANVITANTYFAGDLIGTASVATSASFATFAPTAVSASFAAVANSATSASFAENAAVAVSASFSEDARTADSATSASFAENASIAVSSSFAEDARTADSATSASFASTVSRTLVQNLTIDGAANGTVDTLAIASNTASIDLSAGNFFQITLQNGVDTHLVASNIQAGQNVNLKITNNGTGAGTLSFDTNDFKFADGTPFVVTATTSAVDLMSFVTFDTNNLIGTGIKAIS